MSTDATVPRSQTVELRSHPVPRFHNGPRIAVRHHGGHCALYFDAYWQSFHLAMTESELRELRDAIDAVLAPAAVLAHGGEDGA